MLFHMDFDTGDQIRCRFSLAIIVYKMPVGIHEVSDYGMVDNVVIVVIPGTRAEIDSVRFARFFDFFL